jgi:hypothetical protein
MALDQSLPSGRIKPSDADQVLIASLLCLACSLFDDTGVEVAMHLAERALPMAGSSSRVAALKPVAVDLIAAAPRRRRPDGAAHWARANMTLRHVLAADALKQALARVEV